MAREDPGSTCARICAKAFWIFLLFVLIPLISWENPKIGMGVGSRRDLFSAMEGLISKEWGPNSVTISGLMFSVSFVVAERYRAGDIARLPLGFIA
jgi:hypothetical protein